ncbi:hypothetical protein D3C79_515820 [compost metagenome]
MNITISNIKIHHETTVKVPPVNLIKQQMAAYNRFNISSITDEAAVKYYLRSYLCVYCAFTHSEIETDYTPLDNMADTLWDHHCANLPTVNGITVDFHINHPTNVTWKVSNNKIHPQLSEIFGNDLHSIAFELMAWHLPIEIVIH